MFKDLRIFQMYPYSLIGTALTDIEWNYRISLLVGSSIQSQTWTSIHESFEKSVFTVSTEALRAFAFDLNKNQPPYRALNIYPCNKMRFLDRFLTYILVLLFLLVCCTVALRTFNLFAFTSFFVTACFCIFFKWIHPFSNLQRRYSFSLILEKEIERRVGSDGVMSYASVFENIVQKLPCIGVPVMTVHDMNNLSQQSLKKALQISDTSLLKQLKNCGEEVQAKLKRGELDMRRVRMNYYHTQMFLTYQPKVFLVYSNGK
jgi:hypothetical protein